MSDLLNSNPNQGKGWTAPPRQGYFFGPDVTKNFLRANDLNVIARGHETVTWFFLVFRCQIKSHLLGPSRV